MRQAMPGPAVDWRSPGDCEKRTWAATPAPSALSCPGSASESCPLVGLDFVAVSRRITPDAEVTDDRRREQLRPNMSRA